jgi:hypothetical protein
MLRLSLTPGQKIHYTLRTATAMCFIGHGTFGIITKAIWCNYFAVFGIGHDLAYHLMPVLGSFDILVGITMLAHPMRAIPAWLVVWGLVTALLRPLSGEPFAEFIERAGNFGAPLALLLLSGGGGKTIKGWLEPIDPSAPANVKRQAQVVICLRIVAFLLLLGHGWLNLIGKKALLAQYTSLGFSNPIAAAHAAGLFEIMAACAILIRPFRSMLFVLLAWKILSECFYPHYELFEWIERGGSYGTLLALFFALQPISGRSHLANKEQPYHPAV